MNLRDSDKKVAQNDLFSSDTSTALPTVAVVGSAIPRIEHFVLYWMKHLSVNDRLVYTLKCNNF